VLPYAPLLNVATAAVADAGLGVVSRGRVGSPGTVYGMGYVWVLA
jgi:hypothetical protein